MARCTAIKPNGERCGANASPALEWCWNHDPSHAEERRRNAKVGGKRAGRSRPLGEVGIIKRRLMQLADDVLAGEVDTGTGSVVSQILGVCLRAIDTELKVKEQQDLIDRLEQLEETLEQDKEGYAS
jgi:hypothetical protein